MRIRSCSLWGLALVIGMLAVSRADASCAGTGCVWSDPAQNTQYFDPANVPPAVDPMGRSWTDPAYAPTAPWTITSSVATWAPDWIAPCNIGGNNTTWISNVSSGLPSTNADWYARNTFSLPAGAVVTSAQIVVSADNEVDVFLNGNSAGFFTWPGPGGSHLYEHCVTITVSPSFFQAGVNVLAFRVLNNTSYMGLTYEMCYTTECEETFTPTPTPTRTATPEPTGTPSATHSPTMTPPPALSPTITVTPDRRLEFIPDRNVFLVREEDPMRFWVRSPHRGRFNLILYNSAGEKVRHLVGIEDEVPFARYFYWDGRNEGGEWVANGVYIAYAAFPAELRQAKFIVLKRGSRK